MSGTEAAIGFPVRFRQARTFQHATTRGTSQYSGAALADETITFDSELQEQAAKFLGTNYFNARKLLWRTTKLSQAHMKSLSCTRPLLRVRWSRPPRNSSMQVNRRATALPQTAISAADPAASISTALSRDSAPWMSFLAHGLMCLKMYFSRFSRVTRPAIIARRHWCQIMLAPEAAPPGLVAQRSLWWWSLGDHQ